MSDTQLRYDIERLPTGWRASALGERSPGALTACVLVRDADEPVAGRLLERARHADARVVLGCLTDHDGRVREWLDLWIQDTSGIVSSAQSAREALTNTSLDERWRRTAAAMEDGCALSLGWETSRPGPTVIDPESGDVVPFASPSGASWALCEDDGVLREASLPSYSTSLHRYLHVPGDAGAGFVALTPGAPSAEGVRPLEKALGGMIALNPACGFMLARPASPMTLSNLLDALTGAAWRGPRHGRTIVDFASPPSSSEGDPGDEGVFPGPQGKWGRMVETLHLKLRLMHEAVWRVRELTRQSGRPVFGLTPESFAVRLGERIPGMGSLWTAGVLLTDSGQAAELPIPGSDERVFVRATGRAASVFEAESAGPARSGMGTVRLREVVSGGGGDRVIVEGTLSSSERVHAGSQDLVWMRVPLASGVVDLYASPDGDQALAGSETRVRTLPMRLAASVRAEVEGAVGVPLSNVSFEVLPRLATPCDLYSLGVLGVRALLTNAGTSLPVALDETLSLARELAGQDGSVDLESRVASALASDPRWLSSLGPQRLVDEEMSASDAFGFVPERLWHEVLAALVRMFPGVGPDSSCRDLGDAPSGAVHVAFDRALSDFGSLVRRSRSLVMVDWTRNREVHAVIRGFRSGLADAH